MPGYVRPIPDYPADKWRSTFTAHTRRSPRSSEPGVDYYCPLGTTLYSIGDGIVSEVGGSITQATGRFVKVNLDDGRSFRLLHLGPRHSLKKRGQRVRKGEALAISGASGYGSEFFGASSVAGIPSNTGGPHTHATLWPTYDMRFGYRPDGTPYTLDMELYIDGGTTAAGGSTPFPEDDMFSEQDRANLQSVMLALGAGGLTPGMWKDEDTATGAARAARNAAVEVRDALTQGQTVKRIVNLDQQVTGADGFNPSLVQHVLDIKATLAAGGDLKALTDADLAAIAKAVNDEAHRRSAA